MTKRSGTQTTTNANRGRPMVTFTLAPETVARIDKLRLGKFAGLEGTRPLTRGEYVDVLVENDVVATGVNKAFNKPQRRRVK